jgi:hypothetical protein
MLPDDASRALHAMIWGDASETMSSALWRRRWHWRWGLVRLWVDWVAVTQHGEPWGHCKAAYEAHMSRVLGPAERARRAGL